MTAKRSERKSLASDAVRVLIEEWQARGLTPDAAFRDWAVCQVLWDEDMSFDDVQLATRTDGKDDMGIDAWYYVRDHFPRVLYLFQSKNTRAKVEDLDKLREGFIAVFHPVEGARANDEVKTRAAELLTDSFDDLRIEFHLVTSDIATEPVRNHASALSDKPLILFEKTIEAAYEVHDIEDLARDIRYSNTKPIDHTFTVPRDQYFMFETADKIRTATAVIPAFDLVRLFHAHRTNLFRLNPRYYQTAKTAVNSNVLKTLRDPGERSNFFIYNNGITVVCNSVSATPSEDSVSLLVRGFQIVNGCQTTLTLAEVQGRESVVNKLTGVDVLMRVTETQQAAIADGIAKWTNSQNPMKPEDFKANDRRHERLHDQFNRLDPSWFYEFKRGVWNTEYRGRTERQPFIAADGTARRIQMKDLGQACLAFLDNPVDAAEKARSIFTDDSRYDSIFPEAVQASQLLLPYVVYLAADRKSRELAQSYAAAPYLRFAAVFCVSQVLHEILGVPGGRYFDPTQSEALVRSMPQWLDHLLVPALDELRKSVEAQREGEPGVGARTIVRRSTWYGAPYERLLDRIRVRLETEAAVATATGQTVDEVGLRAAFPLPLTV
ncbi:MAG: AIPR family protein [Dehalococcoidia bacterium]